MGSRVSSLTNSLECKVIFDKYAATLLLDRAEQEDGYMEECVNDRLNAKARKEQSYQPNRMTVEEYQQATAFLERSRPLVPKRLQNDLDTVFLMQLMPSADDGMPHTRPGNIICFPDMVQLYSISTLKHELWHVHQRNYQELWQRVFLALGWKPWSGTLPSHLEGARRFNPDTLDSMNWIFRDTWVPVPVFRDITQPKVSGIDVWFYHVVEQYHTKQVPSELSAYFPHLPAVGFEHPREITAYMLAEPETYVSSPGFQELVNQIGHISVSS